MTSKIIAIQGNHPSKLNPITDTSIFLGIFWESFIGNQKEKVFAMFHMRSSIQILQK